MFLIKNPQALLKVIDLLHEALLKEGHLIAFERLFKGSQSALVVYGPRNLLLRLSPDLNLLELEEYAKVDPSQVVAWEVGTKDQVSFHLDKFNVFEGLPSLQPGEQFWWQIVLQPTKGPLWPNLNSKRKILDLVGKDKTYLLNLQKMFTSHPQLKEIAVRKNQQKTFQAQIRAVLVSFDSKRRENVSGQLANLANGKLVKLPKPFTSEQILDLYNQRSKSHPQGLILTSEEVLKLTGVVKD